MRIFIPAIAVLLFAAPSAIAGPQRTSNLDVRVNVVRSCVISVDSSAASHTNVTCSASQAAPVITTTSTTVPSSAPAARETPAAATDDASTNWTTEAPATNQPQTQPTSIQVVTINF